MIDIKFLRENPDIVKQNIKNKFQDEKLQLVDEVIELDEKSRSVKCKGDELRARRNSLSDQIGNLMRNGQKEEAESVKEQVKEINQNLSTYKHIKEIIVTTEPLVKTTTQKVKRAEEMKKILAK